MLVIRASTLTYPSRTREDGGDQTALRPLDGLRRARSDHRPPSGAWLEAPLGWAIPRPIRANGKQTSDEDRITVVRSLRDPGSLRRPAACGDRVEFALIDTGFGWGFSGAVFVGGQYSGSIGPGGYDGSHWNSLILSHAYYLAIEGGTNAPRRA